MQPINKPRLRRNEDRIKDHPDSFHHHEAVIVSGHNIHVAIAFKKVTRQHLCIAGKELGRHVMANREDRWIRRPDIEKTIPIRQRRKRRPPPDIRLRARNCPHGPQHELQQCKERDDREDGEWLMVHG